MLSSLSPSLLPFLLSFVRSFIFTRFVSFCCGCICDNHLHRCSFIHYMLNWFLDPKNTLLFHSFGSFFDFFFSLQYSGFVIANLLLCLCRDRLLLATDLVLIVFFESIHYVAMTSSTEFSLFIRKKTKKELKNKSRMTLIRLPTDQRQSSLF